MRSQWACVTALLLLSACGAAQPGNQSQAAPVPEPSFKPVDGFGDIKFGMSFENVAAAVDSSLFNPWSLKECFRDLPIRGCALHAASESIYRMREGIPYSLNVEINRLDRVTDVGLKYRREGDITGEQCRDIFARTIDWVAADYGPLKSRGDGGTAGIPGNVTARTPNGTAYSYLEPDKKGSFVSTFVELASARVETRTEGKKSQRSILDRNLYVLMSYIVVGEPNCTVDVQFREPDSVERPALLLN